MTTSNVIHTMDAQQQNQLIEQDRVNYQFTIGGELFRASYLPFLKTIVFTQITHNHSEEAKMEAGQFVLTRRFINPTPHQSLVWNEVVNYLDHTPAEREKYYA